MNRFPTSDNGRDPDPAQRTDWQSRFRRLVLGARHDLSDSRVFHKVSVVAFLAWVGLGADGISSSCYGPEEAFRTLGEHTYLAVILAAVMTLTVTTIAIAYSRVIEHFPQGGGGYVVATSLLGEKAGVVSGSALLVDYVLTITISIAASGDALFSFVPPDWHVLKLPTEVFLIFGLTTVNLRGIRESILLLLPIFLLFILTHAILITVGIGSHISAFPSVASDIGSGFTSGVSLLGAGGVILLLIHAYSLGGGTYTGIEAVSNGLPIMREPKVKTGKRTMVYMATSLAFTASGLILCYLLWHILPAAGKTMNAILVERLVEVIPLGHPFVILTLLSEGALLVVAAQAGFADGPRVLANMAVDGWMPKRFASLSEQLTTRSGILLMGGAALAALLYTGGSVRLIVVMYSINVFLTFSITELGMCRLWITSRKERKDWKRKISIHLLGLSMCLTILTVISIEKFGHGGWVTLFVTTLVVALCLLVKRHYREIQTKLATLFSSLPLTPESTDIEPAQLDQSLPTAAILVGGYAGLGIHTTLSALRNFKEHCRNIVFVSVAVVDSDAFRYSNALQTLALQAEIDLAQYIRLARSMGIPADYRMVIGTDVVAELEQICIHLSQEFPNLLIFTGQLVFEQDRWYHSLLHNETAFALQKRLQMLEQPVLILPALVR
jgi:amino acid transporter